MLGRIPLQLPSATPVPTFVAPLHTQRGKSSPPLRLPSASTPCLPNSKYIGFHGGGFLQVAVSEAPPLSMQLRTAVAGRSRTALGLFGQVARSAFELSLRRHPWLGWRGWTCVCFTFSFSHKTIIKTSRSYFACASPATTAATLSSIWIQPSI